jgi:uncharacterized damage-inducible protein DinB
MARYNKQVNQRVKGIVNGIVREPLDLDTGTFFRSIKGTIEHRARGIVVAQKVFLF